MAYGLLLPWLGFYWDDWPAILVGEVAGVRGYLDYFVSDRPLSVWPTAPLFFVFGSEPIAWHLWALLTRVVMALAAWYVVRRIWPARRTEAFAVGALFALSPAFSGQPLPVVYSVGLTAFAAFVGSLAASVRALFEEGRRRVLWHAGAFVLLLASLSPEIFVPIELVRPVLFFIVLGTLGHTGWTRMRATLVHWAAYVPVVAGFVVWRTFVFEPTRGNVETVALENLLSNPLDEVSTLYGLVRHDLWLGIVRVWIRPFSTVGEVATGTHFSGVSWTLGVFVVMGLTVAAVWWVLGRGGHDRDHADEQEVTIERSARRAWGLQALLIGTVGVVTAGVAWWVTHRSGQLNHFQDQVYLPMSLGAAFVIVGLFAWALPRKAALVGLVAVLLAPAAAFHYDVARQHADDWTRQQNFAAQLGMLAPELERGTVLSLDTSAFLVQRGYTIGSMASVMYGGSTWDGEELRPSVWAFDTERDLRYFDFEERTAALDIRSISYSGTFDEVLVLQFRPPACLRLVGRHWREIPGLTDGDAEVAPHSNPGRIGGGDEARPAPGFMRGGSVSAWCRAFVPAQRHAEAGDWERAAALGREAVGAELEAGEPTEWLVFAEAFLRTGRSDDAVEALSNARDGDRESVCRFVTRISGDPELDEDVVTDVVRAASVEGCVR